MAASATASMDRKIENLKAAVMQLVKSKSKSNPSILLNMKLMEEKFLQLPISRIPDHPTYAAMILRAISELHEENEEKGSSEEAISKFIELEYKDLPLAHTSLLTHHLAKLVEKQEIVRDSNNNYMFPMENDIFPAKPEKKKQRIRKQRTKLRRSSCTDEMENTISPAGPVRKKLRIKLQGSDCTDRMRKMSEVGREDQVGGLATEVETLQEGEEHIGVSQTEELEVEKGDELLEEGHKATGAEICPEREQAIVLQSEELEIEKRVDFQEEEDSTAGEKIDLQGKQHSTVSPHEEVEDRYLFQNCRTERSEKEKEEVGGDETHVEKFPVEPMDDENQDFEGRIEGFMDKTREGVVMIGHESEMSIEGKTVVNDGVQSIDQLTQREEKQNIILLEQRQVELPTENDKITHESELTSVSNESEEEIKVKGNEEESQEKQHQEERNEIAEKRVLEERENEVLEEVSQAEETRNRVILEQTLIEMPGEGGADKEACAEAALRRNEMGGEIDLNSEEEHTQKKYNLVEILEEREDVALEEAYQREESEREEAKVENQLEDKKCSDRESQFYLEETRNQMISKQWEPQNVVNKEHKRLRKQQNEACHKITALIKMLDQFTGNHENVGAVETASSSSRTHQKPGPLPLSREHCIQLLTSVNLIGGQLGEIINSYPEIEVPDHKPLEHGLETVRTESFKECQMQPKSPSKERGI